MSGDHRGDTTGNNALTTPQRPNLAQELINRVARASEHWWHLTRGRVSAEEAHRGALADQTNADLLQRVMATHGWPGWRLVGEDGATAAWLITLRADHAFSFQRQAARLMHQAVSVGDAHKIQWVSLHDRCLVNAGARQRYGTQYRLGPDGPERLTVADPLALDERRASVGLPPAAISLEILRRRRASDLPPEGCAESSRDGPPIALKGAGPGASLSGFADTRASASARYDGRGKWRLTAPRPLSVGGGRPTRSIPYAPTGRVHGMQVFDLSDRDDGRCTR
ncbi:DUF6624 domain-containing protein [Streptomyces sp. NPDC055992]|uniref:DUF6624 domain-containing protein n=1 Tax=Streptomyces sp. NPDC055992 TaxID=3345673 RepID=UPI0035D7B328